MKKFLLLVSHALALGVGFALGVYFLPLLTAPPSPTSDEISAKAREAIYKGAFHRNLKDSDALHWGEGTVSIGAGSIVLAGELAPGPDYKLYLSPEFVETEADFIRLKANMVRVGDVKTFKNFLIPIPGTVDASRYNTVVIWCEAFGQFITAAKYK